MPYHLSARLSRLPQVTKLYTISLLLLVFASCKKEKPVPTPPPPPPKPVADISISLDRNHPGYDISPNFAGMSFETELLTNDPGFLNMNNTTAVRLFKNLGPGVIRIGGGTSDQIGWTGEPRTGTTGPGLLTPTDVDRLAAFSKAAGWQVIFGLNISNNDKVSASGEAAYVANALGATLYAFQSGNEPDMFGREGLRPATYDVYAYSTDWDGYYSSVKSQVPQAQFAGPDVANNSEWVNLFVKDESTNLNIIDAHFYVTGPATRSDITYHDILEPSFALPGYLDNLNSQSNSFHIPFRITECNSIWGGGKQDVSDTFAASLWALDFMWQVATRNGQGINFHGGTLRGNNLYYSPVLNLNGHFTAMPEYYAMLAFRYATDGAKVIPVIVNTDTYYNYTAYACVNQQGSYSVTLINKDTEKDMDFTINFKDGASAKVLRLSAPSINSKNEVSFAGSKVSPDGTFVPGAGEQLTFSEGKLSVKIPAGSAAVVVIQ